MTVSKMARAVVETKKKKKRTGQVVRITPHHMAGNCGDNPESVAKAHASGAKDVSANYYIGNNGSVCVGAEEEYRAYTSRNAANDNSAITIEISNDCSKAPWTISEAALNAFYDLAADICRRYNIIPHYDGTKNGTITTHNMFANTVCPGPYLEGLLKDGTIEREIHRRLGIENEPVKPTGQRKTPEEIAKEVISGKWGVGEDRKNRLTKAGYNYREVQKIVNNMLRRN